MCNANNIDHLKYKMVCHALSSIIPDNVFIRVAFFEWNVCLAMEMMVAGGDIHVNIDLSDDGELIPAKADVADVICDYDDFVISVEVSSLLGPKQYDVEAEPAARHLGDIKANTGKPAYCLFVAPTINEDVIAHFFVLHKVKAKSYGGTSVVIPLSLDRFVNMLTQSKNCGYIPSPHKVRSFCEYSMVAANATDAAEEWYDAISKRADNWLSEP